PGAQRRSLLEAIEATPGPQQRFLEHVLSVVHRPEDPIAVDLQLAPVGVGELAKRLLVALRRTRQQPFAHHEILACPVPFIAITSNDPERGRKESADSFLPELVSQQITTTNLDCHT